MAKIATYDGDAVVPDSRMHLRDIEGSVEVYEGPPFGPLEESLRVLEMCSERYAVPRQRRDCFAVLIGYINGAEPNTLARLDVFAPDGCAIVEPPGWSTETIDYDPDDDVVEIVRKLLAGQLAP